MATVENNAFFWQKIDTLYLSSTFEKIREKGESHPKYRNLVYPVEYGRLKDTLTPDHEGIMVYKGSEKSNTVASIILAADILKKDLEAKLLVGCTQDEEDTILRFLNQTDYQKTILVRRGQEIPSWGVTD